MSSKKPAEQKRPESAPESHAESPPPPPPPKDLDPPPELGLNQGQVHPGPLEPPTHAKARLHMDQIDAVATPQGVVLFALTEGGEIWQLTSFAGHQEWTHILTPEVSAEDV